MTGADSIADTALHWSVRLHSGTMSAAEHAELDAWRRAHPEHEKEFQAQEAVNHAASAMPGDLVRRLYGGDLPERPQLGRRNALRAGAVLLLGGGAAAALWANRPQAPASYVAQWSTRKGERRNLVLPDGSVLDLNTDTRGSIALYSDRRVITLDHGEALFDVNPDLARPFIVQAGPARMLTAGKRFNVRHEGAVDVTVQEGEVDVRSGPWWHRRSNRLSAGMNILVDADGAQLAPRQVNLPSRLAWVQGRLVFRDAPLAVVVLELNRYLPAPLRLANERVGRLRLTASFRLDDPAGMVESLPAVLPVVLQRLPDGGAVLDFKPAGA